VNKWGGRRAQALTRAVLERDGYRCVYCGGPATTADHIVPRSAGGTDSMDNLRAACRPCNSSRGDGATGDGRYGATTTVVIGPPGAGKSTYVQTHAMPGDVLVDLDRIAGALSAIPLEDPHDYPEHLAHVAIGARTEAIRRATRLREGVRVWVIHSHPDPDTLAAYRQSGFTIVTVDPGPETVAERMDTRPARSRAAAARWYSTPDPGVATPPRRLYVRSYAQEHPHAAPPSRAW
jgi:HNH endonuclease/AAA domain